MKKQNHAGDLIYPLYRARVDVHAHIGRGLHELDPAFRDRLRRSMARAEESGQLVQGDERNVDVFLKCYREAAHGSVAEQLELPVRVEPVEPVDYRDLKRRERPAPPSDGSAAYVIFHVEQPGRALATFGKWLLSASAYQRYIVPHVADIHYEY